VRISVLIVNVSNFFYQCRQELNIFEDTYGAYEAKAHAKESDEHWNAHILVVIRIFIIEMSCNDGSKIVV
jgi:hypothetical protein